VERALDRREEEFRECDAFVYALLGLVSYAKRFERALSRLEPAPLATRFEDRQIDAVLGLIALSRKALAELQAFRDSAVLGKSEAPRAPGMRRSEVLR